MKLDIKKCLELFCEQDNLTKDWLIKSWSLRDEDRKIALLFYQKAAKERGKLATKLYQLTKRRKKNE